MEASFHNVVHNGLYGYDYMSPWCRTQSSLWLYWWDPYKWPHLPGDLLELLQGKSTPKRHPGKADTSQRRALRLLRCPIKQARVVGNGVCPIEVTVHHQDSCLRVWALLGVKVWCSPPTSFQVAPFMVALECLGSAHVSTAYVLEWPSSGDQEVPYAIWCAKPSYSDRCLYVLGLSENLVFRIWVGK